MFAHACSRVFIAVFTVFTHVLILQAVCIIRIQVVFPPSLPLEFNLTFVSKRLKSHKNSMDPATEGKSLENNLKKAALACAYTLTPASGYLPVDPPLSNGSFRFIPRRAVQIVPPLGP